MTAKRAPAPPTPKRARILLVDDHPLVREGLAEALGKEPDLMICGEAEDGLKAIDQVKALDPSIVILDLAMPVMNGLAAARQISKISPRSILVMYTLFANEQLAKEAKAAGIQAVVSKGNGEDLLEFIRRSLPTAGRPAAKHPTDSRLSRSYAPVLNSRDGSLVE